MLAVAVLALGGVLLWDTWRPARIDWRAVELPGSRAFKASGLVLQYEDGQTIWASRGYDIYRSVDQGPFERVAALRPPLGESWGGYSRTLRTRLGHQELLEVLPLRPDLLLVFGGGGVYRLDLTRQAQERVLTLRYFGRGKGRGVMSAIAVDDQGSIFFGEYTNLETPHTCRLWRSSDEGRSWTTAYELPEGAVLHIHGVQWDPDAKVLWLMTGDASAETYLGFSHDRGEHFEWIGEGHQLYRTCSLFFTPEAVFWATDTEENHLVRWSRATKQTTIVAETPAQALYGEPLDTQTSLLGQSGWDAAVYRLSGDGQLHAIARFTPVAIRYPIPGMRLARGSRGPRHWIVFNPLRTLEDDAAIYRVRIEDVAACAPPPPRWTRRPQQVARSFWG